MFVKKGAKVPRKRTPPVGILHYATDWVLLADLNNNYCFPVHIAFTQLRPDITIFSNSLRKVILIELACPCDENMQSWHSAKINKYLALKTVVESNGWCVELFAVVLGDTALSLFYAVLKNWVSMALVSEALLQN